MLGVILLGVLVVAAALLVLFGVLCLVIRGEDSSAPLASRPPSIGAAFARRVVGLSLTLSGILVFG